MQELTLYYMETCPYCLKVLHYMDEHKIRISLKNTKDNENFREELLEIGGKTQVPCLLIDGKPLYESDDIVKWFEENLI